MLLRLVPRSFGRVMQQANRIYLKMSMVFLQSLHPHLSHDPFPSLRSLDLSSRVTLFRAPRPTSKQKQRRARCYGCLINTYMLILSDFEFVIHLACIIKPRILDIIWPCLLIIMIMTWLFSGILFICALVVSFAALALLARTANDTTRAQINNIPSKSHRPYSKMADTRNNLGSNTWKRGLVGHISKSGKF